MHLLSQVLFYVALDSIVELFPLPVRIFCLDKRWDICVTMNSNKFQGVACFEMYNLKEQCID
mgnify:CR=1 FL=1